MAKTTFVSVILVFLILTSCIESSGYISSQGHFYPLKEPSEWSQEFDINQLQKQVKDLKTEIWVLDNKIKELEIKNIEHNN